MTKTKRELEFELKITKQMYETAHEERMAYYFILESLASHYYYVAKYNAKDLFGKDFMLTTSHGGKDVEELLRTIDLLIKRGD